MDWIKLRWALLLIFLVPIVDLWSPFRLTDNYPLFLREMFISLAACALLLTRLNKPVGTTLWVWILLGLFLHGYYLKSFLLARSISLPSFVMGNWELDWVSIHTIADGFYYITIAFVVFCVAGWFALVPQLDTSGTPRAAARGVSERRAVLLVLVAMMLSAVAGLIQIWTGVGVMGLEINRLPLRLDTVLIRLRTDLTPMIIYLGIWIVDRSGDWRKWLAMLGGLVALALIDGFVSTSRGSLIKLALPVLFLWLLLGRLTRRRLLYLGMIVGVSLLLHPLFTAIRVLRIESPSEAQGIVAEASSVAWDEGLLETILVRAGAVSNRVIGADGVWFVQDRLPEGIDLGWVADHFLVESMNAYYTRQIVGVASAADGRSAGIVGVFLLLGGVTGLVLFLTVYLAGFKALWWWIARWRTAPVAQAIAAYWLLIISMEGALTINNLIILSFTLAAAEWIYGRYLARGTTAARGGGDPPSRAPGRLHLETTGLRGGAA